MNDYMKLVAHAAAKFTGRPAVLSPLLDSYCGWPNKKMRFSSEPIKGKFRIILSAAGLSANELNIDINLTEKMIENETSKTKETYVEGSLKIDMQHDIKPTGNHKWSRDCHYEYAISSALLPLVHRMGVYWTNDDFLVIQGRGLESPFLNASEVSDIMEFRLIPIEIIDVLEPALNVPFVNRIMQSMQKKSSDVHSYVSRATKLPEEKDFLSLLKYVPVKEEKDDFEVEAKKPPSGEDSKDQSKSMESSNLDDVE